MLSTLRRALPALVIAISLFVPATATRAQDATIQFQVFKAGFIIGVGGGGGTLTYKGRNYPLSVGGVSLGATIGVSKAELVGNVFNLSRVEDIAGTYSAVGGSAVLGGGVSAAELQNSKGVTLRVQGKSIGLEFSVDLAGIQLDLK